MKMHKGHKPRTARVLHSYEIDGFGVQAYDHAGSLSADWIAWELQADSYRLRHMAFNPGDVAIDIGAHVGIVSIYMAKRWPGLNILAFEPFPENFRNCMENLRINGVTNVVLSSAAISHDGRLLTMSAAPHNSGGASAAVRTIQSTAVEGISSITLDDVFYRNKIRRCKLLKIDCEGMEYEILEATKVLDKVEYIAGEFHASPNLKEQGWSPELLYAFCSSILGEDKMSIQFNEIP